MAASLTDFLLGSNWNATTGWTEKAGRSYDIVVSTYGDDAWSLAANWDRIHSGSIGWIVRFDGTWGHVAGSLAVGGDRFWDRSDRSWYIPGLLFPWPRDWWVDGARLAKAGWQGAPFGQSATGRRVAQFQNGRTLPPASLAVLRRQLHPVVREWVDDRRPTP